VKRSLLTIAALLGFVGGFVDAAGYLGLGGLFTSHVTGNLAVLGARLARQQMHGGGGVAGVAFIPVFAAAVAAAGIIARASRGRRFGDAAVLLFAEGALLSLTALAGHLSSNALARADTAAIAIIGSMAVVAMGMQNGMMRESFSGQAPTTVMTGNVTQLSLDLVAFLKTPRSDAERLGAVTARIRKYSAALAGFVLGAAAGASLEHIVGMVSLAVPATVLLALGGVTVLDRPGAVAQAQR
jgi:uncharacterized membrane protein YoaK (UPF0700 family)